jgi:hypothetical protein
LVFLFHKLSLTIIYWENIFKIVLLDYKQKIHSLQTDSLRTDFFFSFRIIFSVPTQQLLVHRNFTEAQLGAAARSKGFGFSRIVRGADSHMRCLLFKKILSNQYIFIRIEMLFISDFNTFTLCKFAAYFTLN